MIPLGSEQRPVILKVKNVERAQQLMEICEKHNINCILTIEPIEDISDLRKALRERRKPDNVYAPCPCGSGKKYKFCCAKKPLEIDL